MVANGHEQVSAGGRRVAGLHAQLGLSTCRAAAACRTVPVALEPHAPSVHGDRGGARSLQQAHHLRDIDL